MIKFQSFVFNPFQTNCWIVYNEKRECLIFDPGMYSDLECQDLEKKLSELRLLPVALINTHAHLDHIFGNHFINKLYGLRPILHSEENTFLTHLSQISSSYGMHAAPSPEAERYIGEGKTNICGFEMEIFWTPGHSPGSLSFYFSAEKKIISGDVLFRESIGRTDLPGGDHQTLIDSIQERLYKLDDDVQVLNGHGPTTTIGHEKRNNPFVKSL